MESNVLTAAFVAALLLSLLVKFWLSTRQMRHVAQHRAKVPESFAGTVSLAAHQKAADYTLAKGRFSLISNAWGTVLVLAWTLLGGLHALNTYLLGTVQPAYGDMAYQLALLAAFSLIGSLLDLPFDLYATFRLEQKFGFNRMTWRLYLADAVRSLIVGLLLGLPIAALILWIMGATGNLWWLWAWAAWMSISLMAMVIYPTLIAPLYNRFQPLSDEALQGRVQALMARCGFKAKGLFVMDGSKRSAHANAYFTGMGSAKRVVFYDTLLAKLNGGEMEAVLAHELGHFKRRHITKRIALSFVLSLAGFALLGWLSSQLWFYTGLGVRPALLSPNDATALILFMLVVPPFAFFISPLMSSMSRRHEFEADAYAASQAKPEDLASALLKLHEDNAATLTPDPVYVRFLYSHPPAGERLAALQALPRPA